jgi:hypothetical protein
MKGTNLPCKNKKNDKNKIITNYLNSSFCLSQIDWRSGPW